MDLVRDWLRQPAARVINPGPHHLELLGDLLRQSGAARGLTSDAHLAALAIENDATVFTADSDFARFPGVQWPNPLKP